MHLLFVLVAVLMWFATNSAASSCKAGVERVLQEPGIERLEVVSPKSQTVLMHDDLRSLVIFCGGGFGVLATTDARLPPPEFFRTASRIVAIMSQHENNDVLVAMQRCHRAALGIPNSPHRPPVHEEASSGYHFTCRVSAEDRGTTYVGVTYFNPTSRLLLWLKLARS